MPRVALAWLERLGPRNGPQGLFDMFELFL